MKVIQLKNRTYLTEIPHEGGKISFQYPAFKGDYGEIAKQIDNNGLKSPNSPETASLIYDAWQNPKGEYELEIIKSLSNEFFVEFTGNLYLPKSNFWRRFRYNKEINNGVILEHNPKITNGKLDMNKNDLIKRLQNNDPLVKFVPFGYATESQTISELMKNPYIVARYGEEGVEKIAEVASNYTYVPFFFGYDSVNEEEARISAVCSSFRFGHNLRIYGSGDHDDDNYGHAFGVCKDIEKINHN